MKNLTTHEEEQVDLPLWAYHNMEFVTTLTTREADAGRLLLQSTVGTIGPDPTLTPPPLLGQPAAFFARPMPSITYMASLSCYATRTHVARKDIRLGNSLQILL